MRVEDWRATPSAVMAGLFAGESARWRDTLHWDYDETRRQLERARRQGLVPGLVARDERGDGAGWAFFLRDGDELQIGGVSARDRDVTSTLLGRVLETPAARDSRRAMFFGFTTAPAVPEALAEHGFDVGAYHYLERDLDHAWPAAATGEALDTRCWSDAELEDTAALIESAYPDHDPLRPFGHRGRPGEWLVYTQRLVTTPGCGVFVPELSLVVPRAAGGLDAAALVTRLADDTVHLAQIVVRHERRGAGLASRLLRQTLRCAAAAGHRRLTLLVSERNEAARRLYAAAGFVEGARFVTAARVQ